MEEKNKEKKDKELHSLRERLRECERLKEEYLEGWQRARADFLNYKREEQERFKNFLAAKKESLILKILPILDNFDLAEKNIEKELKSNKTIDGFLRIKKQLLEFLRNEGVEEIKSLGEIFDPFVHEAVEELERDNKRPGTILEEVQKGYKINGRLLRPAKVKIAKKVDKNS